MDQGPRETAHQYAALCYELGRLGSYLQLRVAILGDQFERIVSSSYGERASRTGAEELEATGLDLDSFLLGLLVELGAPRRQGIDAYRLGRRIVEASRSKTLDPTLRRWAQDHRIDAWNRTRAALVLGSVYYHEALERLPHPAWDAVREKFLEVNHPASFPAWLTSSPCSELEMDGPCPGCKQQLQGAVNSRIGIEP